MLSAAHFMDDEALAQGHPGSEGRSQIPPTNHRAPEPPILTRKQHYLRPAPQHPLGAGAKPE